jgi:hypothetical protein
MSNPVDALVLDMLEWIGSRARPYDEVMDFWRTSHVRRPAWEEASARGYVSHRRVLGHGMVAVSALGRAVLRQYRPVAQTTAQAPSPAMRPTSEPLADARRTEHEIRPTRP